MKISLDGGALCVEGNQHFGNYIFTKSLIEAVRLYDWENHYYVYTFCGKPAWFPQTNNIHYKVLKPRILWLSTRVSIEEKTSRKDIFLALNQALPFSSTNKIISFSHGLSFYFYPQYYPDSYYALKDQLNPMVKKSKYIIVPSRRVKTEMEKLFPAYKNIKVFNYGVPEEMIEVSKVQSLTHSASSGQESKVRKKFFLFVGMNHPIKNIEFLVKAFKEFRKNKKMSDYKLFLVGNLDIYEDAANGIYTFSNANRNEIKIFFSEATAYLTASYYESFNFPVLEALAQNCPVVGLESALIPEFKDLVMEAYDQSDFVEKMKEVANGKVKEINRNEVLRRFSWKKYVLKLIELYSDLR